MSTYDRSALACCCSAAPSRARRPDSFRCGSAAPPGRERPCRQSTGADLPCCGVGGLTWRIPGDAGLPIPAALASAGETWRSSTRPWSRRKGRPLHRPDLSGGPGPADSTRPGTAKKTGAGRLCRHVVGSSRAHTGRPAMVGYDDVEPTRRTRRASRRRLERLAKRITAAGPQVDKQRPI